MKIKFDQGRCICKETDFCSCVCLYVIMLQRDGNNAIGIAKELDAIWR